jgi:hypothetical protein
MNLSCSDRRLGLDGRKPEDYPVCRWLRYSPCTWVAAVNGTTGSDANPSGIQGICPVSWHMPGDAEWKELEIHLGSYDYFWTTMEIETTCAYFRTLSSDNAAVHRNHYDRQGGFSARRVRNE